MTDRAPVPDNANGAVSAANETPTGLVRYDDMCRAIAAARAVDEAKDIRDKALALAEYARQARNHELERMCVEIRLRAERRTGELLAEKFDREGRGRKKVSGQATLSELGLSRNESGRFQDLARVPEPEFEAALHGPRMPSADYIIVEHQRREQERRDAEAEATLPVYIEKGKPFDPSDTRVLLVSTVERDRGEEGRQTHFVIEKPIPSEEPPAPSAFAEAATACDRLTFKEKLRLVRDRWLPHINATQHRELRRVIDEGAPWRGA
jgi:hypothetical protein